ncbi:hypothetical protein C8J56DRAFT_1046582 [Mycena floridula]|nr:hypothetical protein C8J56DRAFT_1046582 [Mycena floridula]
MSSLSAAASVPESESKSDKEPEPEATEAGESREGEWLRARARLPLTELESLTLSDTITHFEQAVAITTGFCVENHAQGQREIGLGRLGVKKARRQNGALGPALVTQDFSTTFPHQGSPDSLPGRP